MKEYIKPEVDFVSLIAQEIITTDDEIIDGVWGDESSWFE